MHSSAGRAASRMGDAEEYSASRFMRGEMQSSARARTTRRPDSCLSRPCPAGSSLAPGGGSVMLEWEGRLMGDGPAPPRTETDWRVPLWFFSWLTAMFMCSAGLVLVLYGSPAPQRYVGEKPWVILVGVGAAALCVAAAASPWLFGIRCRRCRRRLRRMAGGTDLRTSNAPL